MPTFGRLGRYELLQDWGSSFFGTLFFARDVILERPAVLRVVGPTEDPERTKLFILQDGRLAATLSHPGIAQIYEVDPGEPTPPAYVAREYLPGTSVESSLREHGAIPPREASSLIIQVAEALSYVHARGMLHCALKPTKMIQDGGRVRIYDFSLGRSRSLRVPTKDGDVVGTPYYMSPEQIRGEELDPRSDIFSLGASFYRLLTNQYPFNGDTLNELVFQALAVEPAPLFTPAGKIDEATARVVHRMLEKNPADRFQSCEDLAAALREISRVEGREGPSARRDVFICHAGEDKASVVQPLAAALARAQISYWLDQAELRWGDSLTARINDGLANSRYVLVVLSDKFLAKPWPRRELNAALSIEASKGLVKVLPLLVGTEDERQALLSELPLLNDKLYLPWSGDGEEVARSLRARLGLSDSPGSSALVRRKATWQNRRRRRARRGANR